MNKFICAFFTLLFCLACSEKVSVIDGLWGVYKIEYEEQDLIYETRKTVSIVDNNMYVQAKDKKFLIELFNNNIQGDFICYSENSNILVNLSNVNDYRYENTFNVVLDTINKNEQYDIINLLFSSKKNENIC